LESVPLLLFRSRHRAARDREAVRPASAGAHIFLPKPYTAERLLKALAELLSNSEAK
jgi:CheY-like chemotaxis protein